MNVFTYDNYKKILKSRVKEFSRGNRKLTLKKLASHVSVQYTYLSKVLNNDGVDLNQDQLYESCQLLDFFTNETDYILLLRDLTTATSKKRQEYLRKKVQVLRRSKELNAKVEESI